METINSRRVWFVKMGGVSALITGLLLLIGILSPSLDFLIPGTSPDRLSLFENNWLVKIFILHADVGTLNADLQGRNLLDIFILLLVSVTCFSTGTLFTNARKVWSLIASAVVLIGIVLFLATQIAGRSGVMLAVLIISFVVLKIKFFSKVTIYTGIFASIFLFVGDFTVGIHSYFITVLFGLGYLLLIAWCFLFARNLFQIKYLS